MTGREAPFLAHQPRRSAVEPRARGPQASAQAGRSPGAAAQLAALHRTLRHGPAVQLRASAAKAPAANCTGLSGQLKAGVPINDDAGLEREAEAMGRRAADAGRDPTERSATDRGRYRGSNESTKTAQLYSNVSKNFLWGYGKGAGVNAPTFDFQQVSASRVANAAARTIDYGIDAAQVNLDEPELRVADDNLMAVPAKAGANAKTFFATPAKIAESNVLLHNSGAPLRLTQGAGEVLLSNMINPLGPTLKAVTPDLANVDNVSSECGAFARNILGTAVENAETALGQTPGLGNPPGRDAMINAALAGQDPDTLGANRSADPAVGEAFGIYARQTPPPVDRFRAVWNGILSVRDAILDAKPHLLWNEHWAGVVAKSGSDYVTLENYNRQVGDTDLVEEEVEKEFAELVNTGGIGAYVANTAEYAALAGESLLERVTRLGENHIKYAVQIGAVAGHYQSQYDRWYFQMYGTAGKSFHEEWKKSLPDSVTFRTRGTDAQLQALLVPKLNSLLPNDAYQAGAAATLAIHVNNVNAAVGRAAISAAFAAGEKAVCLARLTSANAVETLLPHDLVALGVAFNQAIANVNAAAGDAVNLACVQGIAAMQAT